MGEERNRLGSFLIAARSKKRANPLLPLLLHTPLLLPKWHFSSREEGPFATTTGHKKGKGGNWRRQRSKRNLYHKIGSKDWIKKRKESEPSGKPRAIKSYIRRTREEKVSFVFSSSIHSPTLMHCQIRALFLPKRASPFLLPNFRETPDFFFEGTGSNHHFFL